MPRERVTPEQVWQLIAAAAHTLLTCEQVIDQLLLALRRDLNYLAYRERRGRQTAYDELKASDVETVARAIHFLQEGEATH